MHIVKCMVPIEGKASGCVTEISTDGKSLLYLPSRTPVNSVPPPPTPRVSLCTGCRVGR
jgi:hypothetical protein